MLSNKENLQSDSDRKIEKGSGYKNMSHIRKTNDETLKLLNHFDNLNINAAKIQPFEFDQTLKGLEDESREEFADEGDTERGEKEEMDFEAFYRQFMDFERQKKAEINSKKLELLGSITNEKVKVKGIEIERQDVARKMEVTLENAKEFKTIEDEYVQRGVELIKQQNLKNEGNLLL